jgi:hypothetical protein
MVLTCSLRVADMIKLWALERLAAVIAIAAIVRDQLFFQHTFAGYFGLAKMLRSPADSQ